MSKSAKISGVIAILVVIIVVIALAANSGKKDDSYSSNTPSGQTQGAYQNTAPAAPASGKADDIIGDFKAESQTEDRIASEDDSNSQSVAGDASSADQFNTNTDENQY